MRSFMLSLCLLSSYALGEIINVPADQPTIQIAISESQAGDIIVLQPGTYFEAINFAGKRITIQSIDPLDPSIVASTIIDALSLGSVVTFLGSEDEFSNLRGLTIQGGQIGIHGNACEATLDRLTVRDNGTGIQNFHGTISNSQIVSNSGVGILGSEATIIGCKISNNDSYGINFQAAGNMTMTHSEVQENFHGGIFIAGGNTTFFIQDSKISHNKSFGLYTSVNISPSNILSRCLITGNWASGINGFPPNGTIENTIVAGNKEHGISASQGGSRILNCTIVHNGNAGISNTSGSIKHCILWNNQTPVTNSSTPILSGTVNPLFLQSGGWDLQNNRWLEGNYHLSPDSPYINAGDPSYPLSDPQLDADGNPRVVAPRIDIGAYEFQANCVGEDFDLDGMADHCDKDIDDDGVTNSFDPCDFTLLGSEVDGNGRPRADLNLDCAVNLSDYAIMQRSFAE